MIRIFISLILIFFGVSSANAEVIPKYAEKLTFLRAALALLALDERGLVLIPPLVLL